MFLFKYLIIWCVIFYENVSQPVTDRGLENNTKKVHGYSPKKLDKVTKSSLQEDRASEPHDFIFKVVPKVSEKAMAPTTVTTSSTALLSVTPASLTNDYTPDSNSIIIPKYGMGLIGFAIVILSLIILLLLLMLYKLHRKRYADSICEEFKPKTQVTSKYSRQISGGEISNISTTLTKDVNKESKLCLSRNDSRALLFKEVSPNATIQSLKVEDHKTSKPNFTDIPTNSHSDTHSTRKPTLSRVLQQPNPLISREQMNKLLDGVLAKTNKTTEAISLTDLDRFLNEHKEKDKTDIEKCLSTPELDSEIYDVLPTDSPKKVEKKHDNAKSSESNDLKDNVIEDSIYDNPPPRNDRKRNVIVSAKDVEEDGLTDYVVPISRDPGIYGNCKTVQMAQ